jgi:HEAT repeat protein
VDFLQRLLSSSKPPKELTEADIEALPMLDLLKLAIGSESLGPLAAEYLGELLEKSPPGAWALPRHFDDRPLLAYLRSGDPHWSVIAVACMHPSGWVREAAIKAARLDEPRLIPYVAPRANDWVPAVAERAQSHVLGAIASTPAEALLKGMTPIARLRHGRREAGFIPRLEQAFLARPDLLALARRYGSREVRSWAFDIESGKPGEDIEQTILWALTEPHADLARKAAELALTRLQPEKTLPVIRRLAVDKSAQVRRVAIEMADALGPESNKVLEKLAVDSKWHLRAAARFLLEKRGVKLGAPEYRKKLPIPGAVAGLGEVGSREDLPVLVELLSHSLAEVREQAAWAVGKVGPGGAFPELTGMLSDSNHRVSNQAMRTMSQLGTSVGDEEIDRLVAEHIARALAVSQLLGRWREVRILLLCCQTESGSRKATRYLNSWLARSKLSPGLISEDEVSRAQKALALAGPHLDPDLASTIDAEIAFAWKLLHY